MTVGIPQIILTVMIVAGWAVSLSRYGETKKHTYDLIDVLVGPATLLTLLWWGGFYG
jgi:hypothetical protein